MKYHFEPETGWINDPNGLCEFGGSYHVFYQHNPFAPHWDTMYWGHAVSRDLISWKILPIALSPDKPYEDDKGCFSGSAIEKDGTLYIYYTATSKKLGQTQCLATTDDCKTFKKYEGNPVIPVYPENASRDFRDPKVIRIGDAYFMVIGSTDHGRGAVLLYRSGDLFHWDYDGVLYRCPDYDDCIECPDLFPLGDRYVLVFSKMHLDHQAVFYVTGSFDGHRLIPDGCEQNSEYGPQFYAPQSFEDKKGRRIQIAWSRSPYEEDELVHAGTLTIPRELTLKDGRLLAFPVSEAQHLLKDESPYVRREGSTLHFSGASPEIPDLTLPEIRDVKILQDEGLVEVFVNGGEYTFTFRVRTR